MKSHFQVLSVFCVYLISIGECSTQDVLDAIVIEAMTDANELEYMDGLTENFSGTTTQATLDEIVTSIQTISSHVEPEELNATDSTDTQFDYPWLLAEIQKDGKHFCAATIIDAHHAITTAYCILKFGGFGTISPSDLNQMRVQVRLASSYKQRHGSGASYTVKKIIYHRKFNVATAFDDIALIQVDRAMPFDEFPISLDDDNLSGKDSNNLKIVGWNTAPEDKGNAVASEILARPSMSECRRNYADLLSPTAISENMICSGGDTLAHSCYWSFGSPLVSPASGAGSSVLVGIYSWGIEALLPMCDISKTYPRPMIFTKIASYTDWIRKNLNH